VDTYGFFSMSGGEISRNTATSYGGGVAVDGLFSMRGGEILGNTASSGFGSGIIVNITFIMSGEARVNADNPVCLVYYDDASYGISSSSLTIGGDFTGSGTVAKIDLISITDIALSGPPAYDWPGRAVLTLGGSYPGSGNLSTLRSRFNLGNFVHVEVGVDGSGNPAITNISTAPTTGYEIGTDGTLQ
jgi:hypothetical protein